MPESVVSTAVRSFATVSKRRRQRRAQRYREKWRIALELLDEMTPQLPAYQAIVFDAGYGVVLPLLAELEKRQEPYVAQVPGNIAASEATATVSRKDRGRPRRHAVVQDPAMRPLTMTAWRDRLLLEPARARVWRSNLGLNIASPEMSPNKLMSQRLPLPRGEWCQGRALW